METETNKPEEQETNNLDTVEEDFLAGKEACNINHETCESCQ